MMTKYKVTTTATIRSTAFIDTSVKVTFDTWAESPAEAKEMALIAQHNVSVTFGEVSVRRTYKY